MKINGSIINTVEEVKKEIMNGVNVLELIEKDLDIDLISTAITIKGEDEDTFYEESAEMIVKAIIYYVLNMNDEEKTLSRCKEIAKIGYENGTEELKKILEKESHSKELYRFMDIATERSQKLILEKLKDRIEENL